MILPLILITKPSSWLISVSPPLTLYVDIRPRPVQTQSRPVVLHHSVPDLRKYGIATYNDRTEEMIKMKENKNEVIHL